MHLDILVQVEEAADQLQHTRECETTQLYNGNRCNCGIQDLRDALEKYRLKMWKENRDE